LADFALWLADLLTGIASFLGGFPIASRHVCTPSVLELVLCYGILFAVLQWIHPGGEPRRRRWAGWIAVAGAMLLTASWATAGLADRWSQEMKITFIDVGQGDSVLAQLPGGSTLLVDGGMAREGGFDAGRWIVAPFLWGQGISRLDFVAITHPQADHAGGLASVVRLFRPREVWAAEPLVATPVTAMVAEAAAEVGASTRIFTAGDRPVAESGVEVTVLWPDESPGGLDANERSLVLRIAYGKRCFLLTGDLEREGEERLLRRDDDLSADILKVGHHGGRGGTSEEFLARVRPELGVISVGGGNAFGLPHPELLGRLDAAGVRVLRTDRHGAVTIRTDGDELMTEPWIAPPDPASGTEVVP
jgi:competence protein ComEC